ncbi:tetratricopeptide repeat protein [Oleiagrimonas sp.]|uniref:tetratricopeptide repeat protein n=1 Tax=Oleiagrimonas sp. TaxID=2010330 RepID=UPI00260E9F6D|nr:tetratricopeptide repeat protein [Oleiagrimonas sp.]MDA3914245.1 tetratricopeptide repeat protein [Oleiagrimonas sp.]
MMRIRLLWVFAVAMLLEACVTATPPKPVPPPSAGEMLSAIDAAGQQVHSAVSVLPLRDSSLQHLLDQAHAQRAAGQYAQAAQTLDKALAISPHAPELLQARAELAVRLHHYAKAEQLARSSWTQGPRVGSLCARNWETVAEMRRAAGDASGAAQARSHLSGCSIKGVIRM